MRIHRIRSLRWRTAADQRLEETFSRNEKCGTANDFCCIGGKEYVAINRIRMTVQIPLYGCAEQGMVGLPDWKWPFLVLFSREEEKQWQLYLDCLGKRNRNR